MHGNQILPIVLSRIGKMKLRIDLGQNNKNFGVLAIRMSLK